MKLRFGTAVYLSLCIALLSVQAAEAGYVDPNTGGLLFQLLASAFAILSGLFLLFARRIRMAAARMMRWLRERFGRSTSSTVQIED